jgi:hypothetical protein
MHDGKGTTGAASLERQDEVHSVGGILAVLRRLADHGDRVSVGDMFDAVGNRSYGPAIMIPALIEISPIGGIPGVPTLLAVIILIAAAQVLIGREHLWLPAFAQRRAVSSAKVRKAADRLDRLARRLDRWFHGRLPRFVGQPWPRIAAVIVLALCLTVPPLELLPFASTAPMAAIIAIGLALLARDGLLMLVSVVLGGAALAAAIWLAAAGPLLA